MNVLLSIILGLLVGIGLTVVYFLFIKVPEEIKQLKIQVIELKFQKMKCLLKDASECDYLTRYLILYEAGFVDKEIISYIGNNT